MSNSTTLHVSLYHCPGLFADAPAESDTTTDSEDQHTLTAFSDVRRPSFPMKHTNFKEGEFGLMSPASKFLKNKPLVSSPSHLSPSFFVDALKNSLRSGKQRATQRSQLDAVESETGPRATASPGSGERSSSTSYDCEQGQSVIAKAVPSVADVPEPANGWKKLPPRLPIPNRDVDD
ncbi:uncharacterized protein EDB91DRAFT_1165152 [Suillus paluster]|uniref:uncharacterized protein n=1 Tax=Suillus paluster TaxID=48578 RepID=UPI001B88597F|nr:uncharacterized protein EDB91DRAFT_1165152 [Suillus paluster]KAG1726962.1 hypothetical protein EDB91DRAFT_1165152 [Suillus paluster]